MAEEKTERNQKIYDEVMSGEKTMYRAAKEHGVSYTRIRHIIEREGDRREMESFRP